MPEDGRGDRLQQPARAPRPHAPVGVLEVHPVALIELADRPEELGARQERLPGDVAALARLLGHLLARDAVAHPGRVSPLQIHCAMGVEGEPPGQVQDQRLYRAYARVLLEPLHQRGDRAGLCDRVVVHHQDAVEAVAHRMGDGGVVAARVPQVVRMSCECQRVLLGEAGELPDVVGAGRIVHEDDLVDLVHHRDRRRLGQLGPVPVEDDRGDSHGHFWRPNACSDPFRARAPDASLPSWLVRAHSPSRARAGR